MESEIETKRNIFRASLRREYIESYQKKIRMKYMEEETRAKIFSKNQQIIANLEAMLMLSSQQIATLDNFQYLMESAYAMGSTSNEEDDIKHGSNRFTQNFREGYFSRGSSFMGNKASIALNKRPRKQRIQSLIYKILQKSFNQSTGRLRFVLDKIFYLLQYPELMPLWEKLSHINQKLSKQKSCQRFIQVLSGVNNNQSLNKQANYQMNILDPNFALDVLINFTVENPEISFQFSLKFMPYIAYCLKEDKIQQKHLTRLDKICFILRSFLKTEGKVRVCQLIQEGYQSILIGFINLLNSNDLSQTKEYQNECFYISPKNLHQSHKPSSDWTTTNINILKLINRIFVVNSEAGQYLYQKCSHILFPGLFRHILIRKDTNCRANMIDYEQPITGKYKFIILCDSHRNIIRHTFLTLSTIMMSCRATEEPRTNHVSQRILEDFLQFSGLEFLQIIVQNTDIVEQYKKQITTVLSVLDNSNQFYSLLSPQSFQMFFDILIQVFMNKNQDDSQPNLQELYELSIEDSYSTTKILKSIKNCLLRAYSRATDPSLFEEMSGKILFTQQIKRKLIVLIEGYEINREQERSLHFQEQNLDEIGFNTSANNIKNSCNQILHLCEDAKLFMQSKRQKSGSKQVISIGRR